MKAYDVMPETESMGPKAYTEDELIKDGLSSRKPMRDWWEPVAGGEVKSTFDGECDGDE